MLLVGQADIWFLLKPAGIPKPVRLNSFSLQVTEEAWHNYPILLAFSSPTHSYTLMQWLITEKGSCDERCNRRRRPQAAVHKRKKELVFHKKEKEVVHRKLSFQYDEIPIPDPKAKPIFSVKIFQELKNSNFLFKEPNAIVLDKEDFPVSSQPTRREMMMRQQIANYL
ncbi:hypothetical protein SLEP1_g39758 [Rubroshorea leprosula]|uniref:Uncharacterized protein n=1 Tax=Rubroshorea leprosula TaxID=152421 RepID=A0AAV5L1L4_9ROSI|nr:hypothetical protein SLEP1_g39758 [Rubroshorea leprosula]